MQQKWKNAFFNGKINDGCAFKLKFLASDLMSVTIFMGGKKKHFGGAM